MGEHTPGPWKVQQMKYGFAITDQEGYEISPTRNISDARLIAAAPELLAALEAVIEWYDMEADHSIEPDFYKRMASCQVSEDMAREAIAKAKGGKE